MILDINFYLLIHKFSKLGKAFANGFSANIKIIKKTQLHQIKQ